MHTYQPVSLHKTNSHGLFVEVERFGDSLAEYARALGEFELAKSDPRFGIIALYDGEQLIKEHTSIFDHTRRIRLDPTRPYKPAQLEWILCQPKINHPLPAKKEEFFGGP